MSESEILEEMSEQLAQHIEYNDFKSLNSDRKK